MGISCFITRAFFLKGKKPAFFGRRKSTLLLQEVKVLEKICTSEDTREISLTIYNGGFGAVKEVRTVSLNGDET